jgi:predicted amidohydrolase YtcJ
MPIELQLLIFNTHAIGDSANTVILKVYKEALKEKKRQTLEN